MAEKKVLIVLADGFEDIEGIAPVDILDRAGVNVKVAGLSKREVISGHGVKISTDAKLDEFEEEFDCVVFPGGSLGAENLSKSETVKNIIKKMHAEGKIIAAICASPAVVLAPTGILKGKKATCYPGMEKTFPASVKFVDEEVVVDGNIITSKGPGTAHLFGLKLAELLAGKTARDAVKTKMLF
ncbi:MAG: DJ-1/PfpI family protein [Candidatus Omnitrophica bacterium]|nr:DJ-1/PfpI family protein [Candidatus Omnitrophota bacterium]